MSLVFRSSGVTRLVMKDAQGSKSASRLLANKTIYAARHERRASSASANKVILSALVLVADGYFARRIPCPPAPAPRHPVTPPPPSLPFSLRPTCDPSHDPAMVRVIASARTRLGSRLYIGTPVSPAREPADGVCRADASGASLSRATYIGDL